MKCQSFNFFAEIQKNNFHQLFINYINIGNYSGGAF